MADQTDEDRIKQQYQDSLGRAPTADELASDSANAQKYGFSGGPNGGVQATIANRATNTPNSDGGGNANQSPTQAWNSGGGNSLFPDWYQQLMTRQVGDQEAASAQAKQRSDALYSTLSDRAGQSLNVNASDPIIANQVNAYRAEQDRSSRNYLGDLAEQSGPYANLRGEQRSAAEKVGQNTGSFQAQLIGGELQSRRAEIAQALSQQGGMLSGDQQRALQAQLAQMDQAIAEANAKTSASSVANQFSLGQQGLGLQAQGLNQSNDQFLKELALRQWQAQDNSNLGWAQL